MKNAETVIQVFIRPLIPSDSSTQELDKVNGELQVCACNTQWVSDWTSQSQEMACQYGLLWSPFMRVCCFCASFVSINPSQSIVDLHVFSGMKSGYPDTSGFPASSLRSSFRLNLCSVIDLLSWWNSFIHALNIFAVIVTEAVKMTKRNKLLEYPLLKGSEMSWQTVL